jgi:hypothetical protein
MKVKVLVNVHDVTKGKIYETIEAQYDSATPNSVWVMDDVNDEYILFPDEYEVVV